MPDKELARKLDLGNKTILDQRRLACIDPYYFVPPAFERLQPDPDAAERGRTLLGLITDNNMNPKECSAMCDMNHRKLMLLIEGYIIRPRQRDVKAMCQGLGGQVSSLFPSALADEWKDRLGDELDRTVAARYDVPLIEVVRTREHLKISEFTLVAEDEDPDEAFTMQQARGWALRKMVRESGYTEASFLNKSGISKGVYHSYIISGKEPSMGHMKRLIEIFGPELEGLYTTDPRTDLGSLADLFTVPEPEPEPEPEVEEDNTRLVNITPETHEYDEDCNRLLDAEIKAKFRHQEGTYEIVFKLTGNCPQPAVCSLFDSAITHLTQLLREGDTVTETSLMGSYANKTWSYDLEVNVTGEIPTSLLLDIFYAKFEALQPNEEGEDA